MLLHSLGWRRGRRLNVFGGYIRGVREARGLTLRQASKLAGISHSRLAEIEQGKAQPTGRPTSASYELVVKLADGFGIPRNTLLAHAGYPVEELRGLTAEDRSILAIFHALSEDRKSLAIAMLRTFLDAK